MFIEFGIFEIARYYAVRIPKLKQRGREWRSPCPVHNGKDDNFSVNPETGQAHCHSVCGKGWDIIGLEQALTGCDFQHAKEQVFEIVGKTEVPVRQKRGTMVCAYNYHDKDGKLLYQVVRYANPKSFSQRRPDGHGDWNWGLGNVAVVPYRLPALLASPYTWITEGEKDTDALVARGQTATCNSGGAGNFKAELVPHFAGKKVFILPDNDEPGRKHARKVAEMLYGTAKEIRIFELPGLSEKGDVSDFLEAGGTVDQIRALYRTSHPYTPESAPHEEDSHVRSLREEVELAGGMNGFWDMSSNYGIATPFANLTKALGGGMRPGEVYAIAGRTGSGKTSLGLQFAITAISLSLGVLIYSMEMTWRTVFQRVCSIEARVDLNEFQYMQERHEESSDERLALARATSKFWDAPIWVSTKAKITPRYLVRESQRLKAKLPKLDLIIVDHMQLMGSDEKGNGEYEKFTAISRALKQSAKELNLPVLVMSQVKRKDEYAELEIDDCRGTGAIEEDLAGLMLLYEDREDAMRCKATGHYDKGPVKTWLKLGKARFGSSGLYLPLHHRKAFTRFDLVGYDDEPRAQQVQERFADA
jgi:KaiC/GvpD/RAD55 family RecA-like ATPase